MKWKGGMCKEMSYLLNLTPRVENFLAHVSLCEKKHNNCYFVCVHSTHQR